MCDVFLSEREDRSLYCMDVTHQFEIWPCFWIMSFGSLVLICVAILPWHGICACVVRDDSAQSGIFCFPDTRQGSSHAPGTDVLRKDLRALSASTPLVHIAGTCQEQGLAPFCSTGRRKSAVRRKLPQEGLNGFYPNCSSTLCRLLSILDWTFLDPYSQDGFLVLSGKNAWDG